MSSCGLSPEEIPLTQEQLSPCHSVARRRGVHLHNVTPEHVLFTFACKASMDLNFDDGGFTARINGEKSLSKGHEM